MSDKVISVVLGSLDRLPFLKLTIQSIRRELDAIPHEIIVIDGGSADGSIAWLVSQKDLITIIQHNRGLWLGNSIKRESWGYFINLGFKISRAKYICMLSDDCILVPSAIKNALIECEKIPENKLGSMAFFWRNWPENKKYFVGRTWGDTVFVNHGIYSRSALARIGFANESDYKFYHADGDICMRMRVAGYECLYSKNSFVEHYAHAAELLRYSNNKTQADDWLAYEKKWRESYGEPSEDWIYQEYKDPFNTYKKFLKIGTVIRTIALLKIYSRARKITIAPKFLEIIKRFLTSS
jgi:GT2 family glycosyltransferase